MALNSRSARKAAKRKTTNPIEKGVKSAQDVFNKILAKVDPSAGKASKKGH